MVWGPSLYIISCERGQSSDRIFASGSPTIRNTPLTINLLYKYVIPTHPNKYQNVSIIDVLTLNSLSKGHKIVI